MSSDKSDQILTEVRLLTLAMTGVDHRLNGMDKRLNSIDGRLNKMDKRFDKIEEHTQLIPGMNAAILAFADDSNDYERRIKLLEQSASLN